MTTSNKTRQTVAASLTLAGITVALLLVACGDATTVGTSDGKSPAPAITPTALGVVSATTASSTVQATGAAGQTGSLTDAASSPNSSTGSRGTIGPGGGTGSNNTPGSDSSRVEGTAGSGARTAGTVVAEGARTVGTPTPNTSNQTPGSLTPGATPGAATTSAAQSAPGATPTAQAGAATTAAQSGAATTAQSGATTAAQPGSASPTAAPSAEGLPVFGGAQRVNLTNTQEMQVVQGLNTLRGVMNEANTTYYRLRGVADSNRVKDFYSAQLTPQNWLDRTSLLSQLNVLGNLSVVGTPPNLYFKNGQVLLVGSSPVLTQSEISRLNLGQDFQPGDILIMTLLGRPQFQIQ